MAGAKLIFVAAAFGWVTMEAVPVTNSTIMLPTRDGVLLHTMLFMPSSLTPGNRVGCVLIRTPYGITAAGSAGDLVAGYAAYGWAAIAQDERGRYASQGEYSFFRSSANDTADLLAWVTVQPWSNGLVAQTGTSANAILGYVGPLASPSPPMQMAAQYNIVGQSIAHELSYQGGAYRTGLVSGWLNEIGEAQEIPNVQQNEGFSSFWYSTTQDGGSGPNGDGDRWALTNYPIVHAAGFYDIFSTAQVKTFGSIQAGGGPKAKGSQILIMEAGGHCGGGAITWPNASWGWDLANDYSISFFESTIGLPFSSAGQEARESDRNFLLRALRREQFGLKNVAESALLPMADVKAARQMLEQRGSAGNTNIIWYVLGPGTPGSEGNIWASAVAWPATIATKYYLQAGGGLSTAPPASSSPATTWIADPALPIPTYGGNNLLLSPCGPQDQRLVESQYSSSMALFTSDALSAAQLANGIITAELWVTSSAVDTDIAVKVTDVFPSGESMLVQDGILRMRWREGPQATVPALLMPGQVYAVTVEVGFMSYVFNAGHRIRVAVSSSNAERFSVNPNTGATLFPNSTAAIVATNAVLTDPAHASALVLPILPIDQLRKILV